MKKIFLSLITIAILNQTAFCDEEEREKDYIKVGQEALYNSNIQEAYEAFKYECQNEMKDQLSRANGCLFAGYAMELANEKEQAIEYYKQACDEESAYNNSSKRGKACLILKKYEKTNQSGFDGMKDFRYLDALNTIFIKEEGEFDETTSQCNLETTLTNTKSQKQLVDYYAEGYASRFDEMEEMLKNYSLNTSAGVEEMIAAKILPEYFELTLEKAQKNGKKVVTVETLVLANILFNNYYNLSSYQPNIYNFIDKSMLLRSFLIANKIDEKEFDKDNCRLFYDENIYFEDLNGFVNLLQEKNKPAHKLAYLLLTDSSNKIIIDFLLQNKDTKNNYLDMKKHFQEIRIPFDATKVKLESQIDEAPQEPKADEVQKEEKVEETIQEEVEDSSKYLIKIDSALINEYSGIFSYLKDQRIECQMGDYEQCAYVGNKLFREDEPALEKLGLELIDKACENKIEHSCTQLKEIFEKSSTFCKNRTHLNTNFRNT